MLKAMVENHWTRIRINKSNQVKTTKMTESKKVPKSSRKRLLLDRKSKAPKMSIWMCQRARAPLMNQGSLYRSRWLMTVFAIIKEIKMNKYVDLSEIWMLAFSLSNSRISMISKSMLLRPFRTSICSIRRIFKINISNYSIFQKSKNLQTFQISSISGNCPN